MTRTLMAVLLLTSSSVTLAQSGTPSGTVPTPDPVRVQLASLLVGRDARGAETFTATGDSVRPRPGDLLLWRAAAVNDLPRPVQNLALTVPFPATTTYVNGSAVLRVGTRTLTPLFSTDGSTFAPAPLKKKVSVTRDGVTTVQEVTVQPNEYRAVRWMLPTLDAKSQVAAEVRTTVR